MSADQLLSYEIPRHQVAAGPDDSLQRPIDRLAAMAGDGKPAVRHIRWLLARRAGRLGGALSFAAGFSFSPAPSTAASLRAVHTSASDGGTPSRANTSSLGLLFPLVGQSRKFVMARVESTQGVGLGEKCDWSAGDPFGFGHRPAGRTLAST